MNDLTQELIAAAYEVERELGAAAGCDEQHPAWLRLVAAERAVRDELELAWRYKELCK